MSIYITQRKDATNRLRSRLGQETPSGAKYELALRHNNMGIDGTQHVQ